MGKAEDRFNAMIPGEVTIEEALDIAKALLEEEGDLAPGDMYRFRMTQLTAEASAELADKVKALRKEHFAAQGKKPPEFPKDEAVL